MFDYKKDLWNGFKRSIESKFIHEKYFHWIKNGVYWGLIEGVSFERNPRHEGWGEFEPRFKVDFKKILLIEEVTDDIYNWIKVGKIIGVIKDSAVAWHWDEKCYEYFPKEYLVMGEFSD
jgi:hypothetical protein